MCIFAEQSSVIKYCTFQSGSSKQQLSMFTVLNPCVANKTLFKYSPPPPILKWPGFEITQHGISNSFIPCLLEAITNFVLIDFFSQLVNLYHYQAIFKILDPQKWEQQDKYGILFGKK